MSQTEIPVNGNNVGKIRINPQHIQARDAYPRLLFQIEIEGFIPEYVPYQTITILQLWGSIYIPYPRRKIANFQSDPLLYELSRKYQLKDRYFMIEIPVNHHQLSQIEEERKGDLEGEMYDLGMLILKEKNLPFAFEHLRSLKFTIPRSHWVKDILPALGYGKFKLIEVPIPEKAIPEIFKKALEELEQAQNHYNNGEYDEAVFRCRNAIQQIPDTLPRSSNEEEKPSVPTKVKERLKQYFPEKILSNSKREALSRMIIGIWNLTSIPHHPSPPKYFNRYDAETVIGITTFLLSYVGRLLKTKGVPSPS